MDSRRQSISLKTKDWTLCLVLFAMLTRHLVSSAPLTTETLSLTPSVDLNNDTTTSSNSSEGDFDLYEGLQQWMTTTIVVAVDESSDATTSTEETSTMQQSGDDGDGEMETVLLPRDEGHLLQTEQLSETSSSGDSGPEVSYDSPVDNRCISAKLVEAIVGDKELQNLAKNASICKWDYIYDVNPRRVPEILMKAECQTPNQAPTGNAGQRCSPVYFYVAVKKMDEGGRWVDCQESIPVACVLANSAPDARPAPSPTDDDYGLFEEDTSSATTAHALTPISATEGDVLTTRPDSVQAPDPSENDDY